MKKKQTMNISVMASLTRHPRLIVKQLLTNRIGWQIKSVMTGLLFILLTACNTTKYIPSGQYFLNSVDIQTDNKGVDKALLMPYIHQQANTSKFGPGVYNWVNNDSNFIKKFIRKNGEAPVVFSNALMQRSESELERALQNLGYLNATVAAEVDTAEKKADVIYRVHYGDPYRIREWKIDIPQLQPRRNFADSTRVPATQNMQRRRLFSRAQNLSLIKEGDVFNLDVLEKERKRLSAQLRNMGYYTFAEENLLYYADTTLQSNQVDLRIALTDSTVKDVPYTVNRVKVYSGYDLMAQQAFVLKDSVDYRGLTVFYDKLHFLRPRVIAEKVMVRPGGRYREMQSESTYSLFQALDCVERVDVQFAELNRTDSALLDCHIYLTPGNNHSVQIGVEGTNKAGDLGIAGDVNYGNLNLFNGSETFNIRLRAAYEFVSGTSGKDTLTHNYYELGVTPSLTFPKMHLPWVGNYWSDRFNTKTQYSLSYNVQKRPEYMRNFFNFNWKFSLASQRSKLSQSWSPLDVNYVNMPWQSEIFQQYLNDLDPLTKLSYANVFTAGSSYHLIFTNKDIGTVRQNLYTIRVNLESSGNMLARIMSASKAQKIDGQYNILGNPFAQYVKGDVDIAETFALDENNHLAFRFGAGVAFPYKNSQILPFEKRYYAGGPNSVRGWRTRYLGPGSFSGEKGDPTTHVGDISLIMSAEYRFKVFSWLEPAFFVDGGNIWTIKDYENQPGGLFQWNKFYKEIALGTGLGFRLDLSFLIVRLDVATQVYNPAADTRFTLFKGNFLDKSAFYIAIGYPF